MAAFCSQNLCIVITTVLSKAFSRTFVTCWRLQLNFGGSKNHAEEKLVANKLQKLDLVLDNDFQSISTILSPSSGSIDY